MTNRTRTDALLLAGFCAFLFLYGLAQFGLIGADEPRYAQVAREMLERRDWITPTLAGQPWLEKPPLYYWQAMLAYMIFGVSDWAARLPSVIDATLMVIAIYFFLRRLRPGFELDGALITSACAGIIAYARAASMDMALTATFAVAMLAWWAWRASESRNNLLAFYVCIAFGTLAKGPIAPFLAALMIVIYAAAVRDWKVLGRTLWIPGILLFCAIALPWYIAVQLRNPAFFHEFIIEHNLERYSQNLYHHIEPFWYYLPVTLLALSPWTVFVIVAFVEKLRHWRVKADRPEPEIQNQFGFFAIIWLIVPVIFFSFSQSKLPGYILPAIPGGALLLLDYLSRNLKSTEPRRVPKLLALLHALFASAPMIPALLIAYIFQQHRLPGGQPMFVALAITFILCAGMALTLVSKAGLRMLRFVTLVPVVLTVAAVLKLGSTDLDRFLSARPLVQEIASMETHPLPLAVYYPTRELEYGLTFYRNQPPAHYDWGNIPKQEHILVIAQHSQTVVARLLPGRRTLLLGHFTPQHLDYYWVAAAGSTP
jgi:4-amino-4-deoxy-L-arabinose transferase-like glycosyltransferase